MKNKQSSKILNVAIAIVAVTMAVYHLVNTQYIIFGGIQHQNVHLGFSLLLVFLIRLNESSKISKLAVLSLAILAVACTTYVEVLFDDLVTREMFNTVVDLIVGCLLYTSPSRRD